MRIPLERLKKKDEEHLVEKIEVYDLKKHTRAGKNKGIRCKGWMTRKKGRGNSIQIPYARDDEKEIRKKDSVFSLKTCLALQKWMKFNIS
jgi:hypothetical protein